MSPSPATLVIVIDVLVVVVSLSLLYILWKFCARIRSKRLSHHTRRPSSTKLEVAQTQHDGDSPLLPTAHLQIHIPHSYSAGSSTFMPPSPAPFTKDESPILNMPTGHGFSDRYGHFERSDGTPIIPMSGQWSGIFAAIPLQEAQTSSLPSFGFAQNLRDLATKAHPKKLRQKGRQSLGAMENLSRTLYAAQATLADKTTIAGRRRALTDATNTDSPLFA